MAMLKQEESGEDFVAVAFDTAGLIASVSHYGTREEAARCAAYFRRHHPSAKVVLYDEFGILLDKDLENRGDKS